MAEIQINVSHGGGAHASLDVPIEIWKEGEGAKAATFVSLQRAGQCIETAPGIYSVRAWFPRGRHLDRRVEIKATEDRVPIRFDWDPGDPAPKERWRQKFQLGPPADLWDIDRFEWSSDASTYIPRGSAIWQEGEPHEIINWRDVSVAITTRCTPSSKPARYSDLLIAPVAAGLPAKLQFSPDGGRPAIRLVPHRPEAQLLLDYMHNSAQREAWVMLDSTALKAKELLEGKRRDPISAALAGFALLRLGRSAELEDWPARLHEYRPWLPDGLVLLAVQRFRSEQPALALQSLLKLCKGGLPIFTDALIHVLDLLRLFFYSDVGTFQEANLSEDDLDQLRKLRSRWGLVADHADLSEPVVTLRNLSERLCDRILGRDTRIAEVADQGPNVGVGELRSQQSAQ